MANYKSKYLAHLGYGEQDFIPCKICGCMAVDVHHIKFRSQGGTDDFDNLPYRIMPKLSQ